MTYFLGLSAKNYFLSLLVWIWIKARFPLIYPIISFYQIIIWLISCGAAIMGYEKYDASSANNLAFDERPFGRSLT